VEERMKKFRGKKRYFRNLRRTVENDLKIDYESWFDFWHIHLDFMMKGNDSLKFRREHIKAHISLYNKVLKKLEGAGKPYQSWVCIYERDTGADALYIHTPNPNNHSFPHKIQNVKWNCDIPSSFKDLINLNKYNVGFYQLEDEKEYFIQSKLQGVHL
jgi:hypothetical protein